MASVVNTQIPTTKSHLNGVSATRDEINAEIIRFLKTPRTPSQIADHFNQTREAFSRNYLYPLRDTCQIFKVEGSNYFQLPKQKNTGASIRKTLLSKSQIYETENFQKWISNNSSKQIDSFRVPFAKICLGITNPDFKIHPDDITKDNWKNIVPNMVKALLEVAKYETVNGEPHYALRQSIRGFLQDGVGIKISKKEGINLKISGTKPKPKTSDLHITPEQIILAKDLLKKSSDLIWLLKFGVKTWTFVRPSTIYLIEIEKMDFSSQTVEYVIGKDGKKLTDSKIIEYAKFRGDKVFSFTRRICHLEVHENKTSSDFDKYILDPDFVEPLEKFYNIRKSQRKKYLFWEDNQTQFTFENYNEIVQNKVTQDNEFFKIILGKIGFQKSDFGLYFRANYGFRHFGIQMWLIATDYNYDLVGEMSHEDTETLKKWYGKRTQKDFQRKIKNVMVY